MIARSKEMFQAGYYLSKYGAENPPDKLGVDKWFKAYRLFYDSLNGGRTVLEFEHSLKNSRDSYDGYFPDTNRRGWRDDDGNPKELSGLSMDVYKEFLNKDESYVWLKIESHIDTEIKIRAIIFDDLIAEDTASNDIDSTFTEGGIKVRTMKSIERNAKMRQLALDINGYKCQICHFDFEFTYGKWGKEFAEVHHIIPLTELNGKQRETDPKTDLAVLCANCHRMIHRRKKTTLTLNELRLKMQ